MLNGILWKLATGVPWRDLPERYGPWQTVYTRFRRWTRAGVWDQLLAAVQRQADAAGALDWELHFVDGTVIRAHQHAVGAKGGTRRRRRSGGARAAFPPRSICAPRAAASR
jgi:transposase